MHCTMRGVHGCRPEDLFSPLLPILMRENRRIACDTHCDLETCASVIVLIEMRGPSWRYATQYASRPRTPHPTLSRIGMGRGEDKYWRLCVPKALVVYEAGRHGHSFGRPCSDQDILKHPARVGHGPPRLRPWHLARQPTLILESLRPGEKGPFRVERFRSPQPTPPAI